MACFKKSHKSMKAAESRQHLSAWASGLTVFRRFQRAPWVRQPGFKPQGVRGNNSGSSLSQGACRFWPHTRAVDACHKLTRKPTSQPNHQSMNQADPKESKQKTQSILENSRPEKSQYELAVCPPKKDNIYHHIS